MMEARTSHILMVDDETRILDVFSLMLRDEGFTVWTAAGPDGALEIVSRERIDIAFLDQCLGSQTGLELMRRMSVSRPDISCVIMTANGNTDLAVEALKTGAADFLTKPFLIADLLKSIDYVNTKRELQRQKNELLATLELKVAEKTNELNQVEFCVLSSLAQAMEKRDIGTYGHSKRVNYQARLIAAALDLGEREREELKTAAMLHDIGKIGITDFILGKQDALNAREKEIIKSHPRKGYEILKPLKQFEPILPAILHHHEHYDGTGYPAGLSGEDIPLYARIIAVADSYDAIISTRPYRRGAAHEDAIAELRRFSGRQFDPRILDAFVTAGARCRRLMNHRDPVSPALPAI